MRLLICTQAIDRTDPVLGFFHTWVEKFATRFDALEVICLKKGEHMLPHNTRVYSLGKERGPVSRLRYAARFLRLAWGLRGTYDTVFVHMNEEYVLLAGVLWRLLGKKVILWRNHKMGYFTTRLACALAHTVCYTSPEAFVARYAHATQMPVGIDTNVFTPGSIASERTILFLGRLDPVKEPEIFLEALNILDAKHVAYEAHIYGDPTPGHEAYAANLKEKYAHVRSAIFHPGVAHDKTPRLYQSHAIYINLTASGSFDKTIGEAMASGCVVVATNAAVREALASGLYVPNNTSQVAADALSTALALTPQERAAAGARARAWVTEQHGLDLLADKLASLVRV